MKTSKQMILFFLVFLMSISLVEATVYFEFDPTAANGYSFGPLKDQNSWTQWGSGSGTNASVSVVDFNGNRHVQLNDSGASEHWLYKTYTPPASGKINYSLLFTANSTNNVGTSVIMQPFADSSSNDCFEIICNAAEGLYGIDEDVILNLNPTNGCKIDQEVEMIFELDIDTSTYSAWYNGTLKGSGRNCFSDFNVSNLDRTHIMSDRDLSGKLYTRRHCMADDVDTECFQASSYPLNVPSTLTLDTGTNNTDNNVNRTQIDDTTYYNVSETAGSPATLINFSFLNFTAFDEIRFLGWYEGNPAHIIEISLYNGSDWHVMGNISEGSAIALQTFSVSNYSQYNNSGIINMTINHTSAGNINHWLAIDQILLFQDPNPPVITLNSGYNNTQYTDTPSVNFTTTDDIMSTTNCTLYADGVQKAQNISVQNNTATVLTTTSLTRSVNYTMVLNCTDTTYTTTATFWVYLSSLSESEADILEELNEVFNVNSIIYAILILIATSLLIAYGYLRTMDNFKGATLGLIAFILFVAVSFMSFNITGLTITNIQTLGYLFGGISTLTAVVILSDFLNQWQIK